MKHLSLILVIFIGLSARSLAGNPIDSLEQTNANLTVEKKIELYRKHLTFSQIVSLQDLTRSMAYVIIYID